MEESAICKAELQRLKEEMTRIWHENRELKETVIQLQLEPSPSLGPQVLGSLGQVGKTLVRKLGGDSANNSFQQDSLDSAEGVKTNVTTGKNNASFFEKKN